DAARRRQARRGLDPAIRRPAAVDRRVAGPAGASWQRRLVDDLDVEPRAQACRRLAQRLVIADDDGHARRADVGARERLHDDLGTDAGGIAERDREPRDHNKISTWYFARRSSFS